MNLKDIDLNLLVMFDELLRQRRVSATAQALGISQPGVSNALNRLRKLLGDELFLRTPQGMLPTPYAEQIAEPVANALHALHHALNVRTSFDAATSTADFTVAMTDVGEIYFLAALMQQLTNDAPHVRLNTVRSADIDLKTEMERGHVDLALGFIPALQAGFFQRRLFRQSYVCLFNKTHRFAGGGINLKQFQEADHVAVIAQGTGHGIVDDVIQRAGIVRSVRLRVPHFMAVAQVLQATDMIAVVPQRFAQSVAVPFGLVSTPCPVKMPATDIHVVWHAQKHRDPANQWLRRTVADLFGE